MRSIATVVGFGFLVACGGAADEQAPAQAPPPPPQAPIAEPAPAPVATPEAPPPAPKASLADLEAAAIKSMVANGSDASKVGALYAQDAVMWMPGSPEAKGREAIQKSYQDFLDTLTNFQGANVRTWTKGNQVVVSFVAAATDKATGKPWGVDGLALYTFNDDGLITKDHTYFDTVTIMKQTGAYKGETPARPVATVPNAPLEAHVAKGDAAEDANVASLNALNNAWIKLDDKALLGTFSDDLVSTDFSDAQTHDKKWLKEVVIAARKSSKDLSWKDWTLLGVEDFTIDEGEYTYTQTADFVHGKVHIPNKKKTVTAHNVEIDQWKDGKIVKSWVWSNNMEEAAQLGVGPAAPKPAAKATPAKPPAAKKDVTAKPPSK